MKRNIIGFIIGLIAVLLVITGLVLSIYDNKNSKVDNSNSMPEDSNLHTGFGFETNKKLTYKDNYTKLADGTFKNKNSKVIQSHFIDNIEFTNMSIYNKKEDLDLGIFNVNIKNNSESIIENQGIVFTFTFSDNSSIEVYGIIEKLDINESINYSNTEYAKIIDCEDYSVKFVDLDFSGEG